ncbi:MAG TPA: hypothetical protein VNQ90_09480 [Chthoniobacteraceae bacterium]|nr:hypothetical protein [Chthoniobacteraceae bacterium]
MSALLFRLATRVAVLLLLLSGLGAWLALADTASGATDGETPASPSPSPTPGRPYPFHSVIFSFDPETGALRIGKNRIRLVYLTSRTRMLHERGDTATWDDLIEGTAVRGSIRKREDGELEVVSIFVGTKSQTPDG